MKSRFPKRNRDEFRERPARAAELRALAVPRVSVVTVIIMCQFSQTRNSPSQKPRSKSLPPSEKKPREISSLIAQLLRPPAAPLCRSSRCSAQGLGHPKARRRARDRQVSSLCHPHERRARTRDHARQCQTTSPNGAQVNTHGLQPLVHCEPTPTIQTTSPNGAPVNSHGLQPLVPSPASQPHHPNDEPQRGPGQ